MMRFARQQPKSSAAPQQGPDTVNNMAAMSGELGLTTVAAAWPAGVSQLAIAAEFCQRSDHLAVRSDWMASTLA
jgi:hypothetical protein